jgi:hypothetical protein
VLEDLPAATGCRARLGVLRELEVAYIEKQPGPRPVSDFAPAASLPPTHPAGRITPRRPAPLGLGQGRAADERSGLARRISGFNG